MDTEYQILYQMLQTLKLYNKLNIDFVKVIFKEIVASFRELNNRSPSHKELYALALLAIDEAMMKISYTII